MAAAPGYPPFPTPFPIVNKGSSSPTGSLAFLIMYFLDGSHSDWDEWNLKVLLICISLLAKDIEDFFF